MKHLFLFIGFLLATTACHRHETMADEEEALEEGQRTVIVYMSAENDLSPASTDNLNSIQKASSQLSPDQHLVAFVDNANTTTPAIIEITNNRRDTVKLYPKDFYSSDPQQFHDVLSTIVKRFPARSYALVLWGHANGWLIENDTIASARPARAYGVDNGSNSEMEYSFGNRWMNVTQMARALEGLPRFEYILADCCCWMCVETAYELRHAARYMIGSPAEIPNDGAPYSTITPMLFGEAANFYEAIVDTYYDAYYNSYYVDASLPLSVVDLDQMEMLAQSTAKVLMPPSAYDTSDMAYYWCNKGESPVMFDMASIMERNLDASAYAEWLKALNTAVPYRRFSRRWITNEREFDVYKGFYTADFSERNYGGLSMFVEKPEYNFSRKFDFNGGIKKMQWYWAVGWDRFQ